VMGAMVTKGRLKMRKVATNQLATFAALNLLSLGAFCVPKTILLLAVAATTTVLSAVIITSNVEDPKPDCPENRIDSIAGSENIFALLIVMICLLLNKTKIVNILSIIIEIISITLISVFSFIVFLLDIMGEHLEIPIIMNIMLYFLAQIAAVGIALRIRSAIS